MERSNRKRPTSSTVEEQPRVSKPVKFYNWLEEVEGRTVTVVKSNIHLENWLLW